MLSKKKKVIILCSMIALLILTGVLNVVLNNNALGKDNTNTGGEVTYGDFFATYRTDRQSTRNQSIAYLDEIIASAASSEDAVKQAQDKKLELVDLMNKETTLEGLIKSQGYDDCIVTMGTENINCILKASDLDSQKVAKILNTLVTETGRAATGIKIIPVA